MSLSFWLFEHSYWLTLPAIILSSGFLIRLFIIFHDCGHGSFFTSQRATRFWGRLTGLLTFTPFYYWNKSHAKHHATSANLDKRGYGDVWMMTVNEYNQAPLKVRLQYRLYRNPLIMFFLGPLFIILISHRWPRPGSNRREKISVHLTNVSVAVMSAAIIYFLGWKAFVVVQLPVLYIAIMSGVWLFYVQHQFEGVYWAHEGEWSFEAASLEGGSFYRLPKVLNWFTGNIGYHHVHHLNSRIPNYFLPKLHERDEKLASVPAIRFLPSFKSLTYRLWDESENRLVGFRHAKKYRGQAA